MEHSAEWTVAEAKAQLSEVMARAHRDGPQTVSKNGKRSVVIVSAEEWDRKSRRQGTLVEFLNASPLKGVELDLRRMDTPVRALEL
jgi:prevent-host-death family protein